MISKQLIKMNVEGGGLKAGLLPQNFIGETEENHDKLQS
jgi:hypothetical protein